MSRDVKLVAPDATIREAAQQMRDGDFGMLPVAENDRMIGAISDRDIAIRAIADDKGPATTVREVMSEGICWAYEDDSVEQAAAIMDFTRQSPRAAQAHSTFLADKQRTCIDCHKGISHRLPKMASP